MTSADGESALALFRRERGRIDLIILDLIMPGMGGKRCLEELLKMDPDVKILVASGYSPDGSTSYSLNAGAKGFVSKPYEVKQLLNTVREVLDEE